MIELLPNIYAAQIGDAATNPVLEIHPEDDFFQLEFDWVIDDVDSGFHGETETVGIDLEPGDYDILFTHPDGSEGDCRKAVECYRFENGYLVEGAPNSFPNYERPYDSGPAGHFHTAQQSFSSLLRSKGLSTERRYVILRKEAIKSKALRHIEETYRLIPMSDVTDGARELARRWYDGVSELNDVREKHKLASDIMNYARQDSIEFAAWLAENTTMIKEEKITLYRYCDKQNEWGNYILEDIYIEFRR